MKPRGKTIVGFPIEKNFFFHKEKTGRNKCNNQDCSKENPNSKFCDECGSPITEIITLIPTEAMLKIAENYFDEDYTYDDMIEYLYDTSYLSSDEFGIFSESANQSQYDSSEHEIIGFKLSETEGRRNVRSGHKTSFSEIEAAFEVAEALKEELGVDAEVSMYTSVYTYY
jgi:hypothetical protein